MPQPVVAIMRLNDTKPELLSHAGKLRERHREHCPFGIKLAEPQTDGNATFRCGQGR